MQNILLPARLNKTTWKKVELHLLHLKAALLLKLLRHPLKPGQVVQQLDQYINEALILKCLDAANAGNYKAVLAFEAFKERCR